MMKMIGYFIAVIVTATLYTSAIATAYSPIDQGCRVNPSSALCQSQNDRVEDYTASIVNILLYVVGTIAVIAIILSGIKYITSNGDQTKVKSAKDTLLYSVVGLVVALSAYVIVNFVVSRF